MRRTYDVHGIRMEVVSENPRLADVFEPYLAPFEAGPGAHLPIQSRYCQTHCRSGPRA